MTDAQDRFELNSTLTDQDSGAVPLIQSSAVDLLATITSDCDNQLVVFDLDSTLLNNHHRSVFIMKEYSEKVNHPMLATAEEKHWVDWSARNTMRNIGLTDDDIDTHVDSYERFWEERFFSDEYCRHDMAIAGAASFVNGIKSAGGMVVYLTGRSESTRPGTCKSLESLGFPVDALTRDPQSGNTGDLSATHCALIMRPDACTSDDEFKREAIANLPTRGAVAAAFDNEPTHINLYRSLLPDATCVHLFTDHSTRHVKLIDGIVSIQHFSN